MKFKTKKLLFLSSFFAISLLCLSKASAADAPIDDLISASAKIDDAMTAAQPASIGAMVFGAGASLLKRVIYS